MPNQRHDAHCVKHQVCPILCMKSVSRRLLTQRGASRVNQQSSRHHCTVICDAPSVSVTVRDSLATPFAFQYLGAEDTASNRQKSHGHETQLDDLTPRNLGHSATPKPKTTVWVKPGPLYQKAHATHCIGSEGR